MLGRSSEGPVHSQKRGSPDLQSATVSPVVQLHLRTRPWYTDLDHQSLTLMTSASQRYVFVSIDIFVDINTCKLCLSGDLIEQNFNVKSMARLSLQSTGGSLVSRGHTSGDVS